MKALNWAENKVGQAPKCRRVSRCVLSRVTGGNSLGQHGRGLHRTDEVAFRCFDHQADGWLDERLIGHEQLHTTRPDTSRADMGRRYLALPLVLFLCALLL